jgi:hypothetical protein
VSSLPSSSPASTLDVPVADDAYVWAIVFDDTARPPEFQFTESAARYRFGRVSISWNAHLFVKVASNSRDDPHASKNLPVPVSHPAPVFSVASLGPTSQIRGYDDDLAVIDIREPILHTLKTDPQTFDDVVALRKTFEIRKNDRDFQVGDTLRLLRTDSTGAEMAAGAPLKYSGPICLVRVTHLLDGYGLQPGWVVLRIEHVGDDSQARRPKAILWQCRPPKGKTWGPGTTKAIARELHAEGFKVRALGQLEGDPFAFNTKD